MRGNKSEFSALTEKAKALQLELSENAYKTELPLIAFYPVDRAVLDIPLRIRRKHDFSQIEAYESALMGSANFRLFFGGGNVIACAAALATLDVIEDEKLVENAATRGAQMLAGMKKIAAGRSGIGDVRGLGLMLAFEFVKLGEGDGRAPDPDAVKRVIAEANKRKMLLLSAGAYAQVIRIIPPLVTTAEEVDLALKILEESLDAAGVKRS